MSLKENETERERKERKIEDCVLSEMQAMRENPSLCCIIMFVFLPGVGLLAQTPQISWVFYLNTRSLEALSICMYMCSCFRKQETAAEFICCSLFSCLPMLLVHLACLLAKLNQNNHSLGYISMASKL